MTTYEFLPGAVAANTVQALEPYAPKFLLLEQVLVSQDAEGGVASTTSPVYAEIVSNVPSGGLTGTQLYFDATSQSWQYGSATNTGMKFAFTGPVLGEWGQVS